MLEADVQDVGLTARRDVARHLEGHRGLAGALGTTDEQEFAGAQTPADGLVERGEAQRDRLVSLTLPPTTFSLRSTRTSSAERGVMLPCAVSRCQSAAFGAALASVVSVLTRSLPPRWCGGAKTSTPKGPIHPPGPTISTQPPPAATARGSPQRGSEANSSKVRMTARMPSS